MRAMILAAGLGSRMGKLTANLPKCLLEVKGKTLIEHLILKLKVAGITEIVINLHYLGAQIKNKLHDGNEYGVRIAYSEENILLDVGGGIRKALPLLGEQPFLVVSADIFTDFDFANLKLLPPYAAHLVMVKNPDFHVVGDFGLIDDRIIANASTKFTFANIGIYQPDLFSQQIIEPKSWRAVMMPAINAQQVSGEIFNGVWHNVGTPIELERATRAV